MQAEAKFWDGIAPKYAKSPIRNMTAYEATLARVAARLRPDDTVLEMGCGTGTTALKLAGSVARYTGTDVSPKMIEIAREKKRQGVFDNLDFTTAPANETRFEKGTFDALLAFNLLHLIEDLDDALTRAHDLLKHGGLFISKTPCLGVMGLHIRLAVPVMRFFGKAPFVEFLRPDGLEDTIRGHGFELVETRSFEGSPHSWYVVARKV